MTLGEPKDIRLPDSVKRAMARQAEAEREKRARIINAQGEPLAATPLKHPAVSADAGPQPGLITAVNGAPEPS